MEAAVSLPTIDEPVVPRALVQVWRDGCEDKARARQAYARFIRRGARPRVNALATVGLLLAGMLVSMGSLYAANGAPLRWLGLGGAVSSPASGPTSLPGAAKGPVPRPHPPAAAPAASPAAVASGLPPEPRSFPAVAGAAQPSAPEQWQRVARALRVQDFTRADAALRELAARTAGDEREAAELAHAQLLLSNGREAAAISMLQFLQLSAGSSSVRRKASELLARQQEKLPPKRSAEAPAGANQP